MSSRIVELGPVTFIPDSAVRWSATGSADELSALQSTSDSAYIQGTSPAETTWFATDHAALSLDANEWVRRIRYVFRADFQPGSRIDVRLEFSGPGWGYRAATTRHHNPGGDAVWREGPWAKVPLAGAPGAQGRVVVRDSGVHSDFMQTLLVAEVHTAPVVTITAPTGTIFDTSSPELTWTLADDQDPYLDSTQVQVYDAATSALVWSSSPDPLAGTETLTLPPSGEFVAWVRVAHRIDGQRVWGPWASQEFAMDVAGPSAPAVAAVWDHEAQAVDVVVQGHVNLLGANQSTLDTDTTGWDAAGASQCTAARSTAKKASGLASLALSSDGSTGMSVTMGEDDRFAVEAGQDYTATCQAIAESTTGPMHLGIDWFDGEGTQIGATVYGTPVTDITAEPGVLLSVTATAPTDAETGALVWGTGDTLFGAEVHYGDEFAVYPGSTVHDWHVGGMTPQTVTLGSGEYTIPAHEGLSYRTIDVDPATQRVEITDYAALRDKPLLYTASMSTVSAAGEVLASEEASSLLVTTSDGRWWLKCHADPTLDAPVAPRMPPWVQSRVEHGAIHRPLDTDAAVKVVGELYAPDGELTFTAWSDAEWATVDALLAHAGTLLLQDPYGGQRWIGWTPGEYRWDTDLSPARPHRKATRAYTALSPPPEA